MQGNSPSVPRAYVLIESEAGHVRQALDSLRSLDGVLAAEAITGPYDIIVTLETPHQREIGRLVMNEIHTIPGVKRTITCHVI